MQTNRYGGLMEEESATDPERNDAEWFQALFEQHREDLYRFALQLMRNPDDAQDLVQESFAVAFQQLGRLRKRSAFFHWVRAIIRNNFRNHVRKAGQSRQAQAEVANGEFGGSVAHRVDAAEEEKRIERALRSAQSLPVKYREILVLRFIEELPYRQIAKALNLPETTVSRRIAYARQSLIKAYLEAETMDQNNEQMDEKLGEKLGELLPIHRAAALGAVKEVERLLASGTDIDSRDEILGATPLFWAVLQGRKEIAQLLLDKGADIDAADQELGFTPLHVATLVSDRDTLELLLRYGADPSIKDKSGKYTPYELAVSRISISGSETEGFARKLRDLGAQVNYANNVNYATVAVFNQRGARGFDSMQMRKPSDSSVSEEPLPMPYWFIAQGCKREAEAMFASLYDVNLRTPSPIPATPLHIAVLTGQYEMIDFLLAKGARMENEDITFDPIHWAAMMGKVDALEFLVSRGANIHSQDAKKDGPLHLAAKRGHIPAARYLIEKGADVNGRGHWLDTPLHCAAGMGHVEMADYLLSQDADLGVDSAFGAQPLHAAAGGGMSFDWQKEMVDFLISKGADVNSRTDERPYAVFGSTALSAAAMHVWPKLMMEHLISRGADIHSRSKSGKNILHVVAASEPMRMEEAVDLILSEGVAVDGRDNSGLTPLHIAAKQGCKKTAEYLIGKGADLAAKDNQGRTPEMTAREAGEIAMVNLLKGKAKDSL